MGMRNNKRNTKSGGLPHPPRRQTDTRDEIGENMKIENEGEVWMDVGAGDLGYEVFGDQLMEFGATPF